MQTDMSVLYVHFKHLVEEKIKNGTHTRQSNKHEIFHIIFKYHTNSLKCADLSHPSLPWYGLTYLFTCVS